MKPEWGPHDLSESVIIPIKRRGTVETLIAIFIVEMQEVKFRVLWTCLGEMGIDTGEDIITITLIDSSAIRHYDRRRKSIDPQAILTSPAEFRGIKSAGGIAPFQWSNEALIAIQEDLAAHFQGKRGRFAIAQFQPGLAQIERVVAFGPKLSGVVRAIAADFPAVLSLEIPAH